MPAKINASASLMNNVKFSQITERELDLFTHPSNQIHIPTHYDLYLNTSHLPDVLVYDHSPDNPIFAAGVWGLLLFLLREKKFYINDFKWLADKAGNKLKQLYQRVIPDIHLRRASS